MGHSIQEGHKVVCISSDFPLIRKYGGTGEEAKQTPVKGEILVVNEVLGEFLRFDKYDTVESNNWWKYDRFAPITEESIAMENLLAEAFELSKY